MDTSETLHKPELSQREAAIKELLVEQLKSLDNSKLADSKAAKDSMGDEIKRSSSRFHQI